MSDPTHPVISGGGAADQPPPGMSSITFDAMLRHQPGLRFLLVRIGWTGRRLCFSLLLVIVPFVLMFSVAALEHRLWLGSVRASANVGARTIEVLGMSMLGDTMVWPFFVLVPTALLLLRHCILRTEQFFLTVPMTMAPAFIRTEEHCHLHRKAVRSLATEDAWRWARRGAVVVGFTFWVWNTSTCTSSAWNASAGFYPYKTSQPLVIRSEAEPLATELPAGAVEALLRLPPGFRVVRLGLETPIPIPKWDTDVREAPWCWGLVRLWTIFGYGLLPAVVGKLLNLAVAVFLYCRGVSRAAVPSFPDRNPLQPARTGAFEIKPLSPDRAGGMAVLAELSLSYVYLMLPFATMTAMPFFKEGVGPQPHNLLLLCLYMPLLLVLFLVPLSAVHQSMKSAKQWYLRQVIAEFNQYNDRLFACFSQARDSHECGEQIRTTTATLMALREVYTQIERMPVWPLDLNVLKRFCTAMLLPVGLFLLEMVTNTDSILYHFEELIRLTHGG